MQKYYLVRHASDPEMVGIKDGSSQSEFIRAKFNDKANFDIFKRYFGSREYWSLRDSIQKLPSEIERADLRTKAKLTDFLSFGPHFVNCPFLISENINQIFRNHRLAQHQLFKTTVFTKTGTRNYWLCHFPRLGDDIYDYSKTTFCIDGNLEGHKIYSFKSSIEKASFEQTNYGLRPDSAYLLNSFDITLDLFVLESSHIIISERLKIALEQHQVSGIRILPAYENSAPWVKVYGCKL